MQKKRQSVSFNQKLSTFTIGKPHMIKKICLTIVVFFSFTVNACNWLCCISCCCPKTAVQIKKAQRVSQLIYNAGVDESDIESLVKATMTGLRMHSKPKQNKARTLRSFTRTYDIELSETNHTLFMTLHEGKIELIKSFCQDNQELIEPFINSFIDDSEAHKLDKKPFKKWCKKFKEPYSYDTEKKEDEGLKTHLLEEK